MFGRCGRYHERKKHDSAENSRFHRASLHQLQPGAKFSSIGSIPALERFLNGYVRRVKNT
jgi:hypothetical protein